MTPETEAAKLMAEYGRAVRLVMRLFHQRFGIDNPVHAYHSGSMERRGFLGAANTMAYSVHGAGCTVEDNEGRIISFDLAPPAQYQFDPHKFKLYADNPAVEAMDDQALGRLAATYFHPG